MELDGGWRRQRKEKKSQTVLMLDKAIENYLAEIESSRKPKTHDAYSIALRFFYQCVGNKPMTNIERPDLLKYADYLRNEKDQAPRSAYNKFENVMTFLKRHDITGKSLKITAHDWPQCAGSAGNGEVTFSGGGSRSRREPPFRTARRASSRESARRP